MLKSDKKVPEEQDSLQLIQSALNKLKATGDKKIRLKLLQSMTDLKAPWVVDVLLGCLDDPYEEIGILTVSTLGTWEDINISMLYPFLTNAPWHVKNRVLKVLGIRKNPLCVKQIDKVIDDPNAEVRRTAAQTLGLIGGEEALALLVRLTKDKNPFVRKSAEKALQETSDLKFT